jgi:hypothetical protein
MRVRPKNSRFQSPQACSWLAQPATQIPNTPGQNAGVLLNHEQIQIVSTLYFIELELVGAFLDLQKLAYPGPGGATPLSPKEFGKRVQHFGKALGLFDDFSAGGGVAVNPVFALFDQLVRLGTADPAARTATLVLTGEYGGQKANQVYTSPVSAAALANAA